MDARTRATRAGRRGTPRRAAAGRAATAIRPATAVGRAVAAVRAVVLCAVVSLALAACSGSAYTPTALPQGSAATTGAAPDTSPAGTAAPTGARATEPPPAAAPPPAAPQGTTAPPPPAWVVGATPLPRRADGFGQVLPTPEVLVNRALPTADLLPPPMDDVYAATIAPVPAAVLARSTWHAGCPVAAADLRYLTMSFLGFDGRHHTGEMLVAASVADAVVRVFGELHAARFPIEEMRVTAASELGLAPTGDGNNTTAFVCRPARGQTRWSAHARGLAVDVNPFHNPYTRGDLVLPELASAYVDRSTARPGMVRDGDVVVRAFTAAGWSWGGAWRSPRDLMHFSATGD